MIKAGNAEWFILKNAGNSLRLWYFYTDDKRK